MEYQDEGYTVEHADYELDQEDPGKFEDPYLRQEVQQAVRGELAAAQQQAARQAAQQQEAKDEEEKDEILGKLETDYPFAATERGADMVIEKVREAAIEDGADPKWVESEAFVQEVNPKYVDEVARQSFHRDGSPRNSAEGTTFGKLWEESRAKRLEWDDKG
jgi:hypothetical protein